MDNMRWLCLDRMNNLFSFIQILRTYTKGGLWALEEGTCDASKSETARTWIQMESAHALSSPRCVWTQPRVAQSSALGNVTRR
jgi:hypothetical protein